MSNVIEYFERLKTQEEKINFVKNLEVVNNKKSSEEWNFKNVAELYFHLLDGSFNKETIECRNILMESVFTKVVVHEKAKH